MNKRMKSNELYFSASDADTKGIEGEYFVYEYTQLKNILEENQEELSKKENKLANSPSSPLAPCTRFNTTSKAIFFVPNRVFLIKPLLVFQRVFWVYPNHFMAHIKRH